MKLKIYFSFIIACCLLIPSAVSANTTNYFNTLLYTIYDGKVDANNIGSLPFNTVFPARLIDSNLSTGESSGGGTADHYGRFQDTDSEFKYFHLHANTSWNITFYDSSFNVLRSLNIPAFSYDIYHINLTRVKYIKFTGYNDSYEWFIGPVLPTIAGVTNVIEMEDIPEPTPIPTPTPTPTPIPTSTPVPTPEPTPTPPPPLTVNYQPNKTAIVVNIAGGQAPYTVSWSYDGEQLGSITTSNSSYRIEGLLSNTNYVISVIDANSDVVVDIVNTGNFEGFIPPSFPSPGELFQKMIDSFGVAGSIGIAIISAAVALGLIVILGLWGWRLAKKWLNAAK